MSDHPDTPAPRFFGLPERGIAPGAAVYIKGNTGATGAKGDKGDKGDEGDEGMTAEEIADLVASTMGTPDDAPTAGSGNWVRSGGLWTVEQAIIARINDLRARIGAAMSYRGTVATVADLPDGSEFRDVYNVAETGDDYVWTGSEWDKLSGVIDLSGKQDVISDLSAIRSGASAGATAYQKPSSGIPATDMAQAVQTSLQKADDALSRAEAEAGFTEWIVSGYMGGAPILGLSVVWMDGAWTVLHNGNMTEPALIESMQDLTSRTWDTESGDYLPEGWDYVSISRTRLPTMADLNAKQDTISDLSAIRSGAAAGATAYQKPAGGIPVSDIAAFSAWLFFGAYPDPGCHWAVQWEHVSGEYQLCSVNDTSGAVEIYEAALETSEVDNLTSLTFRLSDVTATRTAFIPVKTSDLTNDGDGTSPFATVEEVEDGHNLLAYASTTTLALGTAVYCSELNADGSFPIITDMQIPTAAAYFQFELELAVPSTVPATITGPTGWVWLDGHGLPDPADLSGGETICISVRLDCTARTFLASVWRVA